MSPQTGRAIVFSNSEQITKARVLVLRSALRLEVLGLQRRGRSVYSIVKSEFGFHGNKRRVLEQLNRWIELHVLSDNSDDNMMLQRQAD